MPKPSQVPSTGERFKAAIVHPSTQNTNALVAALLDIHQANILELLEDAELLVAPGKEKEFTTLKQSYLQV